MFWRKRFFATNRKGCDSDGHRPFILSNSYDIPNRNTHDPRKDKIEMMF